MLIDADPHLASYTIIEGSAMPVNGFRHVAQALDRAAQTALHTEVDRVIAAAPAFTPEMPRTGKPLSVQMTNCGKLGWLSDKAGGYRYQATHPETGHPWPPIPASIAALWTRYLPDEPAPEACLINIYGPKAKLGMHVDADEVDQVTPVLSVSLGDSAWFRIGGHARRDPSERLLLESGDIVILGGAARRAYHGVDRILPGTSDLRDQPGRINLTLRRVTLADTG